MGGRKYGFSPRAGELGLKEGKGPVKLLDLREGV